MTIQLNPTLYRMWAFKNKQPHIGAWVGGHQKTHRFGAIDSKTGKFHVMKAEWINSRTFMRFVKKIRRYYPGKKIIIILDNACWHKSKKVLCLCENSGIKLFFLPPYSPNLNPTEKVWKRLRYDVTHNYFFDTLKRLDKSLSVFFRSLRGERRNLISYCLFS